MTIMFPLRVVLVTVTKALSTLFRIAFAPQQKSYQTGLLFTHKDDCGGAISVTERCCPAPISLAENIDLSDWCSHYTRIRKAISGTMLACVASVSVWFRSKERPRNGISVLAAREMKQEPKTESGGRRRGRKETSFFPTPSPLFYLRHFSRGLWLSLLVLCS